MHRHRLTPTAGSLKGERMPIVPSSLFIWRPDVRRVTVIL